MPNCVLEVLDSHLGPNKTECAEYGFSFAFLISTRYRPLLTLTHHFILSQITSASYTALANNVLKPTLPYLTQMAARPHIGRLLYSDQFSPFIESLIHQLALWHCNRKREYPCQCRGH